MNNNNYLKAKFVPMHKSIELCDGLSSEYLRDIEKFIAEWESQAEHITVFTSGSTGKPKPIQLAKNKVRASARVTGQFFNLKAGQRLLLNLSPNYIAGKLMIVRALEHDMRIRVTSTSQNPLLDLIRSEKEHSRIDFAAFVPYQVNAILMREETKTAYEKIPNVIIGGAPISHLLEEKIAALKNANFATFGMTETITHIALRNIHKKENHYTCLPGVAVATDDRDCLVIKPNPISGEIVTNDLVEILSEHSFVWKGRIDHVINSGGIKLSPEELEKGIEPIMGARRFYFIGRKSERFGQEVVLYIEGTKPENWEGMSQRINEKLGRYRKPKAVVFVNKFEETASGKVKRKIL